MASLTQMISRTSQVGKDAILSFQALIMLDCWRRPWMTLVLSHSSIVWPRSKCCEAIWLRRSWKVKNTLTQKPQDQARFSIVYFHFSAIASPRDLRLILCILPKWLTISRRLLQENDFGIPSRHAWALCFKRCSPSGFRIPQNEHWAPCGVASLGPLSIQK